MVVQRKGLPILDQFKRCGGLKSGILGALHLSRNP